MTDELRKAIDGILEGRRRDELVQVLIEVQDVVPKQYIPEEVAYYIAEKLPCKLANIYDAISFYGGLSGTPRAKYPIQVCRSVVCRLHESDTLLETLEELLHVKVGSTTYDHRFILEEVPCFGACDVAPAVRINGVVYGNLDSRDKVEALLAQFI